MGTVAVGVSLREAWVDDLLAGGWRTRIDVLEVMVDDLLGHPERAARVRKLGGSFALVAHGVALGIGDDRGPDPRYLEEVAQAVRFLHARWYSEHLCFLRAGNVELDHFAPVGDDEESIAIVAANCRAVASEVGVPLLLENAADVLGWGGLGPDAGVRRGQGYARTLATADVGALLDLTNLLYDARNDGFSPRDYLDALAWERVVQVHLAGGRKIRELWIDSHDRPVEPDALELLAIVAERAPNLRAVTIEIDEDIPTLDELVPQLDAVRRALGRESRG